MAFEKGKWKPESKDKNRNTSREAYKPGPGQKSKPEFKDKNKPEFKGNSKPEFREKSRPEFHEKSEPEPIKIETREQDASDEDYDKLEGRNPVLEALRADRSINKILLARGDREGSIKQIIALAREKGVICQEVDRQVLDGMSSTHAHQGIIAYVAVKQYVEVDDILEAAAAKDEQPFIIILDEVTDPHNLGSILRTANAAGAHGVIIPKRRAIGLTASVSKASAGAVEYVPVARVTNISQTIEVLKKKNIWVVGTDGSGEKSFQKSDLKGPIALVIGSEGEGIGKLVLEKCDFVVNIPMKGQISSLNAAVAGAIIMYEVVKQRTL